VSVGGWTKIRLRRITRSSTCVCLRLRNYYFFAARAPNSNYALTQLLRPVPSLYSRASRSFYRSALARVGCAAPIARCAHVDPHNLCPLLQWGFVPIWGSIGPALRAPMRYVWCLRINAHSGSPTPKRLPIVPMSVCSNLGLDRPGLLVEGVTVPLPLNPKHSISLPMSVCTNIQ
jgi:hypothetical protein